MDDLLFILDTMFAKSITPHVSTNTQQQMTFHLITYHTSCFNKYTTADDISPYYTSQKLNIADDYTGKYALYLGQAEIQLSSPLYDLSMYIEHSDKIAMSLVWTCMALLTDSWAC